MAVRIGAPDRRASVTSGALLLELVASRTVGGVPGRADETVDDQPGVGADAYRRLADAYHAGATLAVATYAGRRYNPVLIARPLWPRVHQLRGDVGARALMDDRNYAQAADLLFAVDVSQQVKDQLKPFFWKYDRKGIQR